MRTIYYACPFCNYVFKDKYSAINLDCPACGNELQIRWLTNGKQECGVVGTTLVCFWGATGSIELPDNITKIGTSVFQNSPKLTEAILLDSIQEIGENAFHFCFRLQNIKLPNSLKIIRKKAFAFTGIQKLFIPKSVELIEDEAFDSCSLIKEIIVHTNNPYYYVKDESLIDKRTQQIIATCCKNKIFYKITLDSNVSEEKTKKFNITDFCEYDKKRLAQALKDIEQDDNKFLICEADAPINNITYLQISNDEDGLYIEFHLQKSPNDSAWENWSCKCNFDKCLNYLLSFLQGKFVPNFDEWELEIREG